MNVLGDTKYVLRGTFGERWTFKMFEGKQELSSSGVRYTFMTFHDIHNAMSTHSRHILGVHCRVLRLTEQSHNIQQDWQNTCNGPPS